ncbi:MAG TPA: hypothetical protein VNJ07_04780 [Chitinophagales bacterium]|nr:hypothetical protein [Chitinophagales bacterium]
MNITGKITGIKYEPLLTDELQKIDYSRFDINQVPTACIITDGKHSFAISKWVSPKRTRSYHYERVYNTLNTSKKITVIPIVKDEGATGDRDFIQWDTVSLMSLLDVFVIFAYYDKAEKTGSKITNQQFDNKYVLSKIKEIEQYHSSALHWNLNELNINLHNIINKVKSSYTEIEKTTRVKLHGFSGLENFQNKIGKDVSAFMEFSRGKAANAQSKEFVTIQPKESLSTLTKAKITINNYLGGQYFFTVDEIKLTKDKLLLIEGKHSVNAILPSKGDIKDGLLKMILYCNLSDTKVNEKKINSEPVLELTSVKLKGAINSGSASKEIERFLEMNNFSSVHKKLVTTLFDEAKRNKFTVSIKKAK